MKKTLHLKILIDLSWNHKPTYQVDSNLIGWNMLMLIQT
jgi:hypothetical protein